jgi:uncharacterized protein (DUF2249 family)/hemerythrin-like domain-containing protein
MSEVREAIHHHHQELIAQLTTQVDALRQRHADADGSALVEFLKSELLPHAAGEERYLYPALDPVIKEHGTPTATMCVDHEFIQKYVRQIEALSSSLAHAPESERATLQENLYLLTLRLESLLEVHLEKEERVYLPLFERFVAEPEQQRILAGMHDTPAEAQAEPLKASMHQPLDVRDVPPAQRHPMIFARFNALPLGGDFVLVNDHDPKPLYFQLKFEFAGQLVWDYLEEGPEVWRVRVGKEA